VALLVLPEAADDPCEVYCYLAGHPHPLLLHGTEVSEIGRPGPALGVIEGAAWEPAAVTVAPGDQIVLYTDGVIEARRRDGPRFGIERLRTQVAGAPDPQGVIKRVRAGLEGFLSAETEDDSALVVVRRRPAGETQPPLARAASTTGAVAGGAPAVGLADGR
jgi:sigma-B regulation protein RsbU (phosphoserine phosphatase)